MIELKWTSRTQTIALAYSPDDRWLAACGSKGRLAVWDLSARGRAPRELTLPGVAGQHPFTLWFTGPDPLAVQCHNGLVFATLEGGGFRFLEGGEEPGRVSRVSLRGGWRPEPLSQGGGGTTDGLQAFFRDEAVSPDGQRVAVVEQWISERAQQAWGFRGIRSALRVREAATGRVLSTLAEWNGYAEGLIWSPDGQLVAGIETLFRTQNGRDCLAVWSEGREVVRCPVAPPRLYGYKRLAFYPSGEQLAIGANGVVRVSSTTTGKVLQAYKLPISRVQAVAYAHSGQTMAAGGAEVYVWDLDP